MRKQRSNPYVLFAAIVASLVIVLPLFALLTKIPYFHLISALAKDHGFISIRLTLITSFSALLISMALGIPLAWWLAHSPSRITHWLRPLLLAPIALPPTVAGLALLGLLSRKGLLGQYIYHATGWQMPFTIWAVIFAGIFVGMPFLVLICESTFSQLPRDVSEAAMIDRASDGQLLWWIAIPQGRSGIITGAALAWARVLGEFGATMMFAGSMSGTTQTWTLQIYQELDINPDSAYALSLFMIIIALFIIVALRKPLRESFAR
jgi:molybdate transport system permease protein